MTSTTTTKTWYQRGSAASFITNPARHIVPKSVSRYPTMTAMTAVDPAPSREHKRQAIFFEDRSVQDSRRKSYLIMYEIPV